MAASHAAVLATVEPVVATIIGVAWFGDSMTPGKLLGIVFILAGIVVLNTKAEAEHDLQDA